MNPRVPIQADTYRLGIICREAECPLSRECANHESAGDYRCEDGMTPDIVFIDNHFLCRKMDTHYNRGALIYDGAVRLPTVIPENVPKSEITQVMYDRFGP